MVTGSWARTAVIGARTSIDRKARIKSRVNFIVKIVFVRKPQSQSVNVIIIAIHDGRDNWQCVIDAIIVMFGLFVSLVRFVLFGMFGLFCLVLSCLACLVRLFVLFGMQGSFVLVCLVHAAIGALL